ncbi:MAG: GTPase Era [Proteobacteria bacterium]|nr:GTPase Era [Pseudomonadota bacterium]MBU1611002.1 GTPase Era [Pseudomonadota bacterium]
MSESHKFGFVAIIGPPNAGKSTLMNGYLGQKVAIVTPKAQTTRNRITGILTREDSQVVFIDTPGVHSLRGKMNRFLRETALTALSSADCVILMLDAAFYASKPHKMEADVANLVKPVRHSPCPVIIAVNKVDKVKDKAYLLPVLEKAAELWPEAHIIPLSAMRGEGREKLLAMALEHLPEGPAMFPEDQVSTVPVRFMAAEIIREKLFMALSQELPYSTAVEIEQFEEDGSIPHIGAVIYVSKKNHKGMVIGKAGANLKKVGTQARHDIEELLGTKVMLELWVKVREGWPEDAGFLRSIGLAE